MLNFRIYCKIAVKIMFCIYKGMFKLNAQQTDVTLTSFVEFVESPINKIFMKNDYVKNHQKDKRIDSFTIH